MTLVGCRLSPRGERGPGTTRLYAPVVFTTVVTVFVLLVVVLSSVIAIVHPKPASGSVQQKHTKGHLSSSALLRVLTVSLGRQRAG